MTDLGKPARLGISGRLAAAFQSNPLTPILAVMGLLLGLLAVIVWRVWRTAQLARDDFGMLLCTGIMVMLVVQIFENVGMTMGIMPITGIPLPFMSYGGSSLITSLAAVGLVLSIHLRRFS